MSESDFFSARGMGILLHPSALPGSPACGTFGSPARNWLNKLSKNGISVWQLLPLSPCDSNGSPYSSHSSFAFNPWFLDANDLVEDGYLIPSRISEIPIGEETDKSIVNFKLAEIRSETLGRLLLMDWPKQSIKRKLAFKKWCRTQFWLEDHVCFIELRRQYKLSPWWEWPNGLSSYNPIVLNSWKIKHKTKLLEHKLIQWHLDRQWVSLKKLAKELDILIFGDLPFYVSRDSADVWSKRSLFSILANGKLELQSGVPPDYFSSTGQLWGTPVYRWNRHKFFRYRWWRRRFARHFAQVDILRLDHFRALESFWEVSGEHETALEGLWRASPGEELLSLLKADFNNKLPLVAEDLGVITSKVEELRDQFCLPGMKILQFAFDGNDENPYLPQNIKGENWVVYTGTHDNPTTLSWWNSLDYETKSRVLNVFGGNEQDPVGKLIEIALSSSTWLAIVPLQDILRLDDQARFNKPGTVGSNWKWRINCDDEFLDISLSNYGLLGRKYKR